MVNHKLTKLSYELKCFGGSVETCKSFNKTISKLAVLNSVVHFQISKGPGVGCNLKKFKIILVNTLAVYYNVQTFVLRLPL